MTSKWVHLTKLPGHRISRMTPIRYRMMKKISLVREGCANRPYFTIHVKNNLDECKKAGIEQIGSYDPFYNIHQEQCVAINFERLRYWLSQGAVPTVRVAELLGLGGFLPVHPRSTLAAHRLRVGFSPVAQEKKKNSDITEDNVQWGFGICKNNVVGLKPVKEETN